MSEMRRIDIRSGVFTVPVKVSDFIIAQQAKIEKLKEEAQIKDTIIANMRCEVSMMNKEIERLTK
ncbi:unnamed protein product [marine sediment metagenome]|uniref:Uncharacterized protein n=1 Tax=marine sediment metagenome TaxID=412755 RepID=X1B7U2_9ZZZZ